MLLILTHKCHIALGLHRSEEGFNYLLDRVASNIEPLRARPGAIEGLINSAKWRTEQLRDSAIEVIGKYMSCKRKADN